MALAGVPRGEAGKLQNRERGGGKKEEGEKMEKWHPTNGERQGQRTGGVKGERGGPPMIPPRLRKWLDLLPVNRMSMEVRPLPPPGKTAGESYQPKG